MVASRKRQAKTANTPILVINAYNLNWSDKTVNKIDNILREYNILHRYAFKQGYKPNDNFLQSLKLFFQMDGFAGLSLNEYLRELHGRD